MALTRWSKLWISATLVSLLAYTIRWLYGNAVVVHDVLTIPTYDYTRMGYWWVWVDPVFSGLVGGTIRLVGVILALASVYLVWGPKRQPVSTAKKYVSLAILLEGLYFLFELPITLLLFARGAAPFLMLAFTLQILLVFPALTVLSRKIWSYTESNTPSLLKWIAVAAVSYLLGIWVNNVFRWFSMANSTTIAFIFSGASLWGFLMTVITLSLTLAFTVAGFSVWQRHQNLKLSVKLFGSALILLGLYFVLYIIYSAVTNTLNYVILVEIWPIPLFGLGLSLIGKDVSDEPLTKSS